MRAEEEGDGNMAAEGVAAGEGGDGGGAGRQWDCVIKEALVGCLLVLTGVCRE